MLAARGNIENRQAILKIGIQPLIPQATDVSPVQSAIEIPIKEYRALIDTGAQRTCLTRSTIDAEKLSHHGKRPIQNVHSVNPHYLYWVNMGFWCDAANPASAQDPHRTYFGLPAPVEVIDVASNNWFDAIIGMDVLRYGNLTVNGTGEFELRFR